MVLESGEVAASGGLPVALAVMVQVVPSGEPAIDTDPLPAAMGVVGTQPAPMQSPIDMVVTADAPDAQRTAPEPQRYRGQQVALHVKDSCHTQSVSV